MPAPDPDQWDISDAWLLAAIAIAPASEAGEGASLRAVISAADGINHAIPSESEVELALRRLMGAGLILVDDGAERITLTGAGWQVRGRWRQGLFGWMEALPPALRRHGTPRAAQWSLPPGAYENAVRAHLKG